MIDFDQNECNSIKSIAIQKNLRLMSPQDFQGENVLMFSKLSLKSFTYNYILFPNWRNKINILPTFNNKVSSLFKFNRCW